MLHLPSLISVGEIAPMPQQQVSKIAILYDNIHRFDGRQRCTILASCGTISNDARIAFYRVHVAFNCSLESAWSMVVRIYCASYGGQCFCSHRILRINAVLRYHTHMCHISKLILLSTMKSHQVTSFFEHSDSLRRAQKPSNTAFTENTNIWDTPMLCKCTYTQREGISMFQYLVEQGIEGQIKGWNVEMVLICFLYSIF